MFIAVSQTESYFLLYNIKKYVCLVDYLITKIQLQYLIPYFTQIISHFLKNHL